MNGDFIKYRAWFTIADVNICIVTPTPLYVEPAFSEFISTPAADAVICEFECVDELPKKNEDLKLVYQDEMHQIFSDSRGVCQYFAIPYAGLPPVSMREPDAYQRLDIKEEGNIKIVYRRQAAHYFATAFGCFNAIKIERLLIRGSRLILHSSFISYKGVGIVFSGRSGIGKSTQADLWIKHQGARIINGDRTAFGLKKDKVLGYGLPVAGSSNIFLNESYPLRAVILLGQAKENKIRRAKPKEAIAFLMSQITVNSWSKAFMDKAFAIFELLLANVNIYRLDATPDINAVECTLNRLKEDGCLTNN